MPVKTFWQHKIDVNNFLDIVSTDLRLILSIFVATYVYTLLKSSVKKIFNLNVQNEGWVGVGWGGQRLFEQR